MAMTSLVQTRKDAITAALLAILAVIPRAKPGQPTFGRGHLPPTRKSVKVVRKQKGQAVAKVVTSKGIRTRESKIKISQRFHATIGHVGMVSANTQTPADTVTMGRKAIKKKQQGQELLEHQCL
jgi:hypothetical protein